MKVEFLNAKLKKSCEDKATRQRLFQKAAADNLATRLDDLAAAASMETRRHHWRSSFVTTAASRFGFFPAKSGSA